jgi:hypothetical protein
MPKFIILLIFLIIIFIINVMFLNNIISWINMVNFFSAMDWPLFFSIIISGTTAFFIFLQFRANKLLAEFTYMPSVGFALKSGQTFCFQNFGASCQLELEDKLDTRLLVNNNSNFPIFFGMEAELEIEYKDNTKKILSEKVRYEWRMNPKENLNGHDSGKMLYEVAINKNIQEFNKIKFVWVTIKTWYSPLLAKKLIFRTDPDTWRFDSSLFQWIDSRGTSDDKIFLS